MAEDPVDYELERMAGNHKLAAELKKNLETLRDRGGDSPLADMARDVLDGKITLRDVARTSAFALPLSEAMDRFHDYDSRLTEDERSKLVSDAEERLGE